MSTEAAIGRLITARISVDRNALYSQCYNFVTRKIEAEKYLGQDEKEKFYHPAILLLDRMYKDYLTSQEEKMVEDKK